METRSNQVLVGSITLGLIAALVLFVIWLSQVGDGGEKKYDVFFQQSVEGLAKGSQVTFSGVPVGQIESINLVPDSPQFIRVRISVRESTPVYEGSTATIRGVGFTGVSQIQLDPPENPRAGPAAPAAARDRLSRAEPGIRMPLWRAGDPDQAGRARPAAQHRARAARTGLDSDRAAHRTAFRPQPGIDRRHPRQSRGGQPLARRTRAGDRRHFGRSARRRSARPASPPRNSAASPAPPTRC